MSKKFDAVIAKNIIARQIADAVNEKEISRITGEIIIERLTDIEKAIGVANQPTAQDIFGNNTDQFRQFTI